MMELKAKLSLKKIQESVNVNDLLSEEDSELIGRQVYEGYVEDKQSRVEWEKKMERSIELALQIVKDKHTPWRNASNVKFPLLTIAALQFASRAYPALVKTPDLVKFRVQGADPQGVKADRATRISAHMSYQLIEEDEPWEEDQDRALIALPILGCVFKKSYYDPILEHNCSKLVLPQNLVVNYYAKSIEECERKTEILPKLSPRAYREKVLAKIYTEHDFSQSVPDEKSTSDTRQGTTPPVKSEFRQPLEQHCHLDLDGDGYEEPYAVTIDRDTQKVLRIVPRFKEIVSEQKIEAKKYDTRIRELAESLPREGGDVQKALRVQNTIENLLSQKEKLLAEEPTVLRIEPLEYYTKYSFIPAPDGGFYDLGFGALLGPLNNSVDTLINQLIDSGTLQNGSVGFIGKGARIKGGKISFSPNEWKRVDVAGATLRDALVPLPVNAPSPVLFQLLSLLITYTERVASVTDATVGENPGQNTPAYNMGAMLEQGLQIFNAIFKRLYRSFRKELRKLYVLNGIYLNPTQYFEFHDKEYQALQEDYLGDPKDLMPAADPNAFSNREQQQKAMLLSERARMVPGYDMIKVEQRFLEAMEIPNASEIFPLDENGQLVHQPGEDPEIQVKKMEEARRTAEGQMKINFMAEESAARVALIEAQIVEVYARAEKTADEVGLSRIQTMLGELAERRKALIEMAKIDEKRADRGVGGESGNSSST